MKEKVEAVASSKQGKMFSNDTVGPKVEADGRSSEQARLQRQKHPLQQSPHSGHSTHNITHNSFARTYFPTISSSLPDLSRSPTRPEPVYLSPRHSHQSSQPNSSSVTLNECCAPRSAQAPTTKKKMGLSKTQRISILLAIDSVFFLVELTCGEWQDSTERRAKY